MLADVKRWGQKQEPAHSKLVYELDDPGVWVELSEDNMDEATGKVGMAYGHGRVLVEGVVDRQSMLDANGEELLQKALDSGMLNDIHFSDEIAAVTQEVGLEAQMEIRRRLAGGGVRRSAKRQQNPPAAGTGADYLRHQEATSAAPGRGADDHASQQSKSAQETAENTSGGVRRTVAAGSGVQDSGVGGSTGTGESGVAPTAPGKG